MIVYVIIMSPVQKSIPSLSSDPFLPTSEPVLDGNEKKYVLDCFKRNWISAGGYFTKQLEERFARWLGVKYAVACSNGTTAIHLALTALGIRHGDEVIIPDFTIICSASMTILTGAKPVLVDVDRYWCMDPGKIEEKVTSRTKVIMPVHMYGNPANMDKILAVAKKHHLFVIEDACAAHGATVGRHKVGSMGDINCFSFYASKNITSGEGGMVVTNSKDLADRLRLLRSHAFEKPRFVHRMLGFNYRLTDLQAAVGLAQLENIDKKVARRREIAYRYTRLFEESNDFDLPSDPPWGKSTFWMYSILLKPSFGKTRDEVIDLLAKRGIGSERFFSPMSQQPVFLTGKDSRYPDIRGFYPVSDDISSRGLYLPSGLGITDQQQRRVVRSTFACKSMVQ